MFVLDCSVTMAWLFDDEKTDMTEKVLDLLKKESAIAPSIWTLEVINVLLVAERRKRVTQAQSIRFMETLRTLPIEIEEFSINRSESLLLLGRSYNLAAYDAAYLDTALRMGIGLATLDANLRKAAKKSGVKLLS